MEDFDLTRPSLKQIAEAGHAFAVPWNHTVRPIFGGFESGHIMNKDGPWIDTSPFEPAAVQKCTMLYESNGASYTYRDAFSSRSQSSLDHLSVSGSISVGPPFLKAEGSGQYDKSVIENENGVQSSRIGSFRVGRVVIDHFPSYSQAALQLLRAKDIDKFRQTYGDFFIRGLALGADAGVCMNAHCYSKEEKEQLKVQVTVKVLFWSATVEHEETSENHESNAELNVCGYSTISGQSESLKTRSTSVQDQDRVRNLAGTYMGTVAQLEGTVRKALRDLKLEEGARVPLSAAYELCRSGIVVQLLLFPYARTEEYLSCING